ncbi:MAG: HEAT repeat domain-containing protein [Pyrinomonadaceae bacterium]|nr:HEAT repeat domain-containing protein [Pyrinomonadaceae bacterium]
MKTFSLVLLFAILSGSANGQASLIGIVDFYGLRSVSEQRARQALRIKEGDALPALLEDARSRLEALPNVEQARLTTVCCDSTGKSILYVGIGEKGAPALRFRVAPQGRIRLPDSMVQAGEAFADAFIRAVQKGDAGEDDSQGHALFNNSEARSYQERFIQFAARDLKTLRAALRQSSDAKHRALAAEIIAYSANKRDVVKDLVYGMSDPNDSVRNNSIRALGIIAGYAQANPKLRIKVPVQPFVAMLNSLEWTDRNKSSLALYHLTEKRDPAILSSIRERALPSLIEMARWKNPGHAFAPFVLLGRIGNLSDEEIWKAGSSGDREILIETVIKKLKAN